MRTPSKSPRRYVFRFSSAVDRVSSLTPMIPRRLPGLAAAAFALLVGRVASAQQQSLSAGGDTPQFIKDRRLGDGIGVRTGDFELHWSLAGEVGYDSNYFLRSSCSTCDVANSAPTAPVIPALEFRLSPSLTIATLSPQQRGVGGDGPPLAFSAGVGATYRDFIGLSNAPNASQPQNDVSAQRNVSGAANAHLDVLPGRPWAGAVNLNYSRVIQPNVIDANPNNSFNTDTVSGTAEIITQPESGTLDWHLGGGYTAMLFEGSNAAPFTNAWASAYTRGRWTFRPRSVLLYTGTMSFQSYANAAEAAQQGLVGSTPIRSTLGLSTLLTDRFALLVSAGWGATFLDTSTNSKLPQYDSVIGQAELKWFLSASPGIQQATDLTTSLSSIAIGYTRDFQTSFIGNFYGSDRGYLGLSYFFANRVTLNLQGGVGAVEYPTLYFDPATVRHSAFTDVRADATAFAEYHVLDNVGINATVRYSQELSDVKLQVTNPLPMNLPASENTYDMAWTRFEAFLGVRWFM